MEKKFVITVNKKILLKLIISFALAVIVVFSLNYYGIEKWTPYSYWITAFGSRVYDCQNRLSCSYEALFEDNDFNAIMFLTLFIWLIFIINHYIKLRIK